VSPKPSLAPILILLMLSASAPALAAEPPAAPAPPEGLAAIPYPAPEGLDPAVAEQLQAAREYLESVLASPPESPGPASRAELAEVYGELGRTYHAYELVGPASVAYRNARALAPADPRWVYLLARLEQDAGSLDEAEALYRRALELRPGDPPALVHLGEVLLALDRLDEAEKVLQEALAAEPGSPAAHAALGQAALSRRRHEDAVRHLEAALAAVPEANRLHYPLALAWRGLGEMEKAQEHLAKRGLVGVKPRDPLFDQLQELKRGERVHILRGRKAFRAGDFAAAAASFREAVEASPESAAARVNLGSALALSGDLPGALEQYLEALKTEPGNATAHYNVGHLLLVRGEPGGAVEHLAAAVRANPGDGPAHLDLARALAATGEADRALEHYAEAVKRIPSEEEAWMGQVNLLVEMGRYREARDRLDEAHAALPDRPRITHALARLLAAAPDPAVRDGGLAVKLARSAFEAQKSLAHAETLARAHAEAGQCVEAAELQRQVIEVARAQGLAERVPEMERMLALYEAGGDCRPPV
jgi:tetratricopeptide (TPR) repeat protein